MAEGPPSLEPSVVLFDLSGPSEARNPLPIASMPPPAVPDRRGAEAEPVETEGSAPLGHEGAAAVSSDEATEVMPPESGAQPQAAGAVSDRRHLVHGVNCARGHFNNPHALYCGICGLAMVQNSVVVVTGSRPPLGVLLSDDGTAYSLEGDYVLGRQPDLAEDVASGRARPLKVDDGTGKISRVHARVALSDWDVVVTDLRSHNGTRMFNPGETTWRTLVPDEIAVLRPGGRIVLGQCTFEFQSIQRQ